MAEIPFSGIQLIGIILAVAVFYYSRVLYKKGNFKRRDFWVWGGFSILLFIVSLMPTFIGHFLTLFTALGRSLDALLIIGLLVAFGLIFQIYVRIQQTNKEITELVRKVALKFEEHEKKEGKKR